MPPQDTLTFHSSTASFLAPYLPAASPTASSTHPFTTLTYATSLDSHLSLSPGVQTHLSGPLSKALTHYLRSKHSAILIGVSTAVADNPGLNCRLQGIDLEGQPRPIVLDPDFRWEFTRNSRVLGAAREGKGKAPFLIVSASMMCTKDRDVEKKRWLEEAGGNVFYMPEQCPATQSPPSQHSSRWGWDQVLRFIKSDCQVDSVMIEGGGVVINSLLSVENLEFIDSVIVTIAPVYLGQGGVNVSPAAQTGVSGQRMSAVKFKDVKWNVLGNDVVMVGRPDI